MLLAVHISSFGCTWEVMRELRTTHLLYVCIQNSIYARSGERILKERCVLQLLLQGCLNR